MYMYIVSVYFFVAFCYISYFHVLDQLQLAIIEMIARVQMHGCMCRREERKKSPREKDCYLKNCAEHDRRVLKSYSALVAEFNIEAQAAVHFP